jgi:hypothetical protein
MVRRENPPPRRQLSQEKFFRCPFQYPKVPLEAGAPPPQSFDASYAPAHECMFFQIAREPYYYLLTIYMKKYAVTCVSHF